MVLARAFRIEEFLPHDTGGARPVPGEHCRHGTIEPKEVIDVGAQVAGRIDRFGQDPRSTDAKLWLSLLTSWPRWDGTTGLVLAPLSPIAPLTTARRRGWHYLAQLDSTLYLSRVEKARADLERAEADLLQMNAKLTQADRDWYRARSCITARRSRNRTTIWLAPTTILPARA